MTSEKKAALYSLVFETVTEWIQENGVEIEETLVFTIEPTAQQPVDKK